MLIKPTGSKYWRLNYRFQGKQKTLSLGVYPSVSLKQAMQKVAETKWLLVKGHARRVWIWLRDKPLYLACWSPLIYGTW
ncbi:Arm DNA-binding domain-containing protein [Microbulbifer sp. NBRC 101763]|uniref:Arm DNA-binding domain-containing protein n=1 Tax=Microbulbifer sp. NBRC 101763 TaxID=1113820 RepID=UPI003340499E